MKVLNIFIVFLTVHLTSGGLAYINVSQIVAIDAADNVTKIYSGSGAQWYEVKETPEDLIKQLKELK